MFFNNKYILNNVIPIVHGVWIIAKSVRVGTQLAGYSWTYILYRHNQNMEYPIMEHKCNMVIHVLYNVYM